MDENIHECISYEYQDKFLIEDLENRFLLLNDAIDANVFDTTVYHILRYNRVDADTPIEDRKPIILFINSCGGSISDGYGLIDAIRASKTPVYTVNLGMCASMAFLVFIAGHKRYTMPHSEFLLHDGSIGAVDSTAKFEDLMRFHTEQIEEMTRRYILSQTKISEPKYIEQYRKEWYFLPQEAKELGVVDYIVGEDCDIDEIL